MSSGAGPDDDNGDDIWWHFAVHATSCSCGSEFGGTSILKSPRAARLCFIRVLYTSCSAQACVQMRRFRKEIRMIWKIDGYDLGFDIVRLQTDENQFEGSSV